MFKAIFDVSAAQLYNGNWFDLPDDEAEIKIDTEYLELMFAARRPPEVVINLQVSEKDMLDRLFDRDAIKTQWEEQMQELKEKRAKQREEDMAAKETELREDEEMTDEKFDEEMKAWNEERDQQEKDLEENDDEAPNLDEMLEAEETRLKERREKEAEETATFVSGIKEKGVPVFSFNADLTIQ